MTRHQRAPQEAGTSVRHLTVSGEDDGQRIDNFLLRTLKGLPRTRLYRLLRKGEIRVNGGRIRPIYRLKRGDQVRLPPIHGLTGNEGGASIPRRALERLAAAIIHEDDALIVLDKPSGFAVHGGSGLAFGVIEALRCMRPGERQLELVHRLDRETSGCLLVAKRRSTLRALNTLVREGGLRKRYSALLKGRLPRGATPVEAALDPDHRSGGERTVQVALNGKRARSVFHRVGTYGEWSLAEVAIDTGRTHQIRVHAAHIGHPLGGDTRYGDAEANRRLRDAGLRRMFLHAGSVAFDDPASGRHRCFSAPLPAELQDVLSKLAGDGA